MSFGGYFSMSCNRPCRLRTRAADNLTVTAGSIFGRINPRSCFSVALHYFFISRISLFRWLFNHSWTSSANQTVTPSEIFFGWGKCVLLLHQRHSVDLLIANCRANSCALRTAFSICFLSPCLFSMGAVCWSFGHKKRAVIFYDPLFFGVSPNPLRSKHKQRLIVNPHRNPAKIF